MGTLIAVALEGIEGEVVLAIGRIMAIYERTSDTHRCNPTAADISKVSYVSCQLYMPERVSLLVSHIQSHFSLYNWS